MQKDCKGLMRMICPVAVAAINVNVGRNPVSDLITTSQVDIIQLLGTASMPSKKFTDSTDKKVATIHVGYLLQVNFIFN